MPDSLNKIPKHKKVKRISEDTYTCPDGPLEGIESLQKKWELKELYISILYVHLAGKLTEATREIFIFNYWARHRH